MRGPDGDLIDYELFTVKSMEDVLLREWEIDPADVRLLEKIGEGEFGQVFRVRLIYAATVEGRSSQLQQANLHEDRQSCWVACRQCVPCTLCVRDCLLCQTASLAPHSQGSVCSHAG